MATQGIEQTRIFVDETGAPLQIFVDPTLANRRNLVRTLTPCVLHNRLASCLLTTSFQKRAQISEAVAGARVILVD